MSTRERRKRWMQRQEPEPTAASSGTTGQLQGLYRRCMLATVLSIAAPCGFGAQRAPLRSPSAPKSELLARLYTLPRSFHDKTTQGSLPSLIVNDSRNACNALVARFSRIIYPAVDKGKRSERSADHIWNGGMARRRQRILASGILASSRDLRY
jgi:hypothetical protein